MTTLNRRTFLRGLVYGLLGALGLGWPEVEAIAAATEAALPVEEERVELSWTVPTPCHDCAVANTGFCDLCDEYSEWTAITSGYVRVGDADYANEPSYTVYFSATDGGSGWVSYDSGLNWSRCDDIGVCGPGPDDEWMSVAEYAAIHKEGGSTGGVCWSQTYYPDPIEQAIRDMGIAARNTLDRELGIEGDKE